MRFLPALISISILFCSPCFAAAVAEIPLAPLLNEYQTPTEARLAMQAVAADLRARGDHRSLFPAIYALTIATAERELSQNYFVNKEWVSSLVVNYANIYRHTILDELLGRRGNLPKAWQYEFDYVESTRKQGWIPDLDMVYSIHVHITRDLVEAMFVTPTDYGPKSTADDFFKITTALQSEMPRIWTEFLSYESIHFPAQLALPIMSNWIGELRSGAWQMANVYHRLPAEKRQSVLDYLDQQVVNSSRSQGLMAPLSHQP